MNKVGDYVLRGAGIERRIEDSALELRGLDRGVVVVGLQMSIKGSLAVQRAGSRLVPIFSSFWSLHLFFFVFFDKGLL